MEITGMLQRGIQGESSREQFLDKPSDCSSGGSMLLLPTTAGTTSHKKNQVCGRPKKFVSSLFQMLEKATEDKIDHIISWQEPGGKAFVVHKPDELSKILPKYNMKINFHSSFRRQLNNYGFRRVMKRGVHTGAYQHDMFQRDRPDLMMSMDRIAHKPLATAIMAARSQRREQHQRQEPQGAILDVPTQPAVGASTATATHVTANCMGFQRTKSGQQLGFVPVRTTPSLAQDLVPNYLPREGLQRHRQRATLLSQLCQPFTPCPSRVPSISDLNMEPISIDCVMTGLEDQNLAQYFDEEGFCNSNGPPRTDCAGLPGRQQQEWSDSHVSVNDFDPFVDEW